MPPVILASGSPRRRELLASLGLAFSVIPPTVDEKDLVVCDQPPEQQVQALALYKGRSIAVDHPEALVIAADTIVVQGHDVLGKPASSEEAYAMLTRLQGTRHVVFSAIALFYQGNTMVDALATQVDMRSLTPEEIAAYVQTGEPMDKAGAYAIQGYGSLLIPRIEGCYFNVVGMSLALLDRLCGQLGFRLADSTHPCQTL